MDNKKRCIELAKQMMNIPEDEKLPRKVQYLLMDAYRMVERTGGIPLSRQSIAAIIVSVKLAEDRCHG